MSPRDCLSLRVDEAIFALRRVPHLGRVVAVRKSGKSVKVKWAGSSDVAWVPCHRILSRAMPR